MDLGFLNLVYASVNLAFKIYKFKKVLSCRVVPFRYLSHEKS